jgi:uncharacterized damage-inducible protein DinB
MRNSLKAFRLLVSACAISLALSLVTLAQTASGQQRPATNPTPPAKEYPAGRVDQLVAEWTRARDYTREYLDAMPEDGIGFKPTPEIRSFAEQMLHLASGNYFFLGMIGSPVTPNPGNLEKNEEMKKTKAALTKAVIDSYDAVIAGVKGLTDAKLDEKLTVRNMSRPRLALLNALFEHQTHHRGQTTIYLRLKGVTPPPEKLF